jgi:hypothetical protein
MSNMNDQLTSTLISLRTVAQEISHHIHRIGLECDADEPNIANIDYAAVRLAELNEMLHTKLDEQIAADAKASHERKLLRQRIKRYVKKIVAMDEDGELRPIDIHSQWIYEEGGKDHASSSVQDLQMKIDWLMLEWPEAFSRDTRTWTSHLTGHEPGLSKNA